MSDLTIAGQSLALNAFESTSTASTAATSGVNDPFLNLNTTSQSSNSTGSAASTHISKGAQLYSKLEQLQQTDPAEYQQVLSTIVSQLQSAASGATGSDATFLNNLADKFQAVENGTASLSSLQPPQGANGQSAGQQSASQYAAQSGADVTAGGTRPDSYVRQTLDSIFSQVLGSTSTSSTAGSTSSSFTDPLLQASSNSSNSSSSLASILNDSQNGASTLSPFVPVNASASNSATESLLASQFALASQVDGVAA